MDSGMQATAAIKLSICITTFNRGGIIRQTLENIIEQLTAECEVVILDGGSADDTEQVVSEIARRSLRLRYVRQRLNAGFDRDCDRAIQVARGEYCWLMADDDLLKPGAVRKVLDALQLDVCVIFANVESRDFTMSKVLQRRWLAFESDRVYEPHELDRFFIDMSERLWYLSGVIIKREIWLARNKDEYYGSWFIFIGVIFQKRLPGSTIFIADPLVINRRGNEHTFSDQWGEIIFNKWPSLVNSLAISETTKRTLYGSQPWKNLRRLLLLRGMGYYSIFEYKRWIRPKLRSILDIVPAVLIALAPGVLVNGLLILWYVVRGDRGSRLQALRESRFYRRQVSFRQRGSSPTSSS